uniref:Uncharacterized protein n=1 Tax=uncultured Desulfobacterium sp. TaxID=201089 RepID=E1YAV2_9BACT|nr:unknown protein [uncultured Desulfobacterium sp.]
MLLIQTKKTVHFKKTFYSHFKGYYAKEVSSLECTCFFRNKHVVR